MGEQDLNAILAEYLEAEDSGNAPGRQAFIERYPEFAAELAEFFANQDEFDSRSEPLSPVRPGVRRGDGELNARFWLSPGEAGKPERASDVAGRQFGDYEVIEEVARGGMGVVYRAQHIGLGRVVALKMVRAGPLALSADLERFRIEAHAVALLDHPNIVPIYEVGECDGQPFFTMKFIEGHSLDDRLADWREDPRRAAEMVVTLARAVHYAHQRGVLHRDLKPANILIEEEDGHSQDLPQGADGQTTPRPPRAELPTFRPFITDFGLAKCMDSQNDLTQPGAVLGTPSYMAPEQAAASKQPLTTGVDVYSLGAILYAMLTGRPPFRAATPVETLRQVMEQEPERPSQLNRRTDRDLETICLKCLEKDSRRRYASADALAGDLDRWLTHQPILARRAGLVERAGKWARRNPALASVVAVIALAAVLSVAGILWHTRRLDIEIERVRLAHTQAESNFVRAESERARAEAHDQEAQRHLFAAQTSLAQHAADAGQLGRTIRLLDGQRPRTGASDLRSFEWHYLWRLCRRGHLRTILHDPTPVRAIAFSPDGQSLLVGSSDGGLRVCDPSTGATRSTMRPDPPAPSADRIHCVVVSPGGQFAATLSESGILRVWDLAAERQRHSHKEPGRAYTVTSPFAFSPDGKTFAEWRAGKVRLWNTDDWTESHAFKIRGASNALAFSPDGTRLGSVDSGREVSVWNLADTAAPTMVGSHNVYAISVAFSPDGKYLASAGEDGVIKLWDAGTGSLIETMERHIGSIYALSFSPDGRQLASAGEDGTARVTDLATGEQLIHGHASSVYSVSFSPDLESPKLATACGDGSVAIWSGRVGREEDVLRGHEKIVYSVAVSRDGETIASGSVDRTVRLWSTRTGESLAVLRGHADMVTSIGFSPDDELLASGNAPSGTESAGTVYLWDVASRELRSTLTAHEAATWGVAFLPDGRTIVTSGYRDKLVKLWDVSSGACLATLEGQPERIFCVAVSPNGRTLAVGSASDWDDRVTVMLWDLQTRTKIGEGLRGRWVWAVAFSPDSSALATAHEGGSVGLWDVATSQSRLTIRAHATAVRSVAFSPDGITLATGSDDRTIRLWDVVTGDERATLRGHTRPVSSLAFSRDGRTLISGSWDGTVRIWRANGLEGSISPTQQAEQ